MNKDKFKMKFTWKETSLFKRNSNLYTFCKDPLFQKNEYTHLYMPWDNSIESDLMYQVKTMISTNGEALIPLMSFDQTDFSVSKDELNLLQKQLEVCHGETHLIMSNFQSIHLFRIKKIISNEKIKIEDVISNFKESIFKVWVVVDDMYILDANHILDESALEQRLIEFIEKNQTQNVFKIPYITQEKKDTLGVSFKWINSDRNFTYDYFIRACELQENVFQDAWDRLARPSQHYLISCELQRQQCVFYRDLEKWEHLKLSFYSYKMGVLCELNEIYTLPLVNAIGRFESLNEAWETIRTGVVDPRAIKLVDQVLSEEKFQIESFEDILFFTQNLRSLFYSLKNYFSKKFHKEEFLLIETFLGKQESLVNSFHSKGMANTIQLLIDIETWIDKVDVTSSDDSSCSLKGYSLKLSYLISVMISANKKDNIIFSLLEEKISRRSVQKSFADEVKELSSPTLKKVA